MSHVVIILTFLSSLPSGLSGIVVGGTLTVLLLKVPPYHFIDDCTLAELCTLLVVGITNGTSIVEVAS